MTRPTLFFPKIAVAVRGLLWFHANVRTDCSVLGEHPAVVIALSLGGFRDLALHLWPMSWGSSRAAYTLQWPLAPEGTSRVQVTGQSIGFPEKK